MCAFKSDSVPGSVHDMSVFKEIVPLYKNFLTKEIEDINVNDAGSMFEWSILADKKYQGADKLLKVLTPPKGREMTEIDKRKFSERIMENFFGRIKMSFKIMNDTFRRSHEKYNIFIDICIALTNFHLINHFLRNNDHKFYESLKTKIIIEKKATMKKTN
ncbi:hypothetical protein A3Q56_06184 [Intoshia linei]|uniref:DDE Tnp4 domain-containing protein n=1 Tax=Intoshia linei TaxID=1819745 RepID=A0A177AXG6_9BILA|nr:hypothetical protein A3Q56_06184 [Intoshia linei]